ncbi:MAG: sodium/proton-translocating pyrophosphatase [Byssovorax sp.]
MTELALIFGIGVLGLAFAAYLGRWILAQTEGDGELARIGARVRAVTEGFSRRQGRTIGALSAVLGGAIFLAYGLLRRAGEGDPVPALELGVWLTVSFAVGAGLCLGAGQVTQWSSVRASLRAAGAVRRSLDLALQIAVRGGAVSGLFLSASNLIGVVVLVAAVLAVKGGLGAEPAAALKLSPTIPMMIAGYALGAAFAALLAQLGGGTFAKAADLGADLACRDLGIGEDDPRNPAAIVDLAGDHIGDGVARSTALFASTAAENLGAMMAGALLYRENLALPSALSVMLFPLVTRAFGLLAAMFGVMVVRTDDRELPLNALGRGLYVTALLHLVAVAGAAKWLLGAHWIAFLGCAATGVAAALLTFFLVQYYTDARHAPVRELAEASRAGPGFTLLHGLARGLEGTVAPLLVVMIAAYLSYRIGLRTGLSAGGLYGAAVATMGMLGVTAYLLSIDAFGPIVDNAGGLVEMTVARDRPDVRGRSMVLDAVGNTVKAITKGHAAGAAALGGLLLIAAFALEVRRRAGVPLGGLSRAIPVDLGRPELYLGAVTGVLLVLWVASRAILGVVRPARRVLDEARRQLKDRPAGPRAETASSFARGALPGFVPDHEACVEIVSRAALRHMIAPAVVAVATPISVGLLLRFAKTEDNPLLAADSIAAMLLGGTVAGVLGSLLLGNLGGSWDNAKKYIATGAHGGRFLVDETGARVDNPTYGAALVGDSVGDPLKDAAGPALHVLAKMLPVVTLVFLPFFL